MKHITDGYIPFRDYKTYYRIFGKPSQKTPLLVLHGGPGSSHDYVIGLSRLATDRQVIFYDQLGGGKSDHPTDVDWTVDLFLDELQTVRGHLKLSEIHLLGHSWGGMLAIEYLLTQPKGIKSAVLASAMISMPLYQEEVEKLKADLPIRAYQTLIQHEKAGTTDSDEYAAAMKVYDKRHIYRHDVWPKETLEPNGWFGKAPYNTLWGVSEAYANGSLKDWDQIDQLKEIKMPVLITSGQYDELTPHQAVITHDNIPGSHLRIFSAGSHCVHVEQETAYNTVVSDFLHTVEK